MKKKKYEIKQCEFKIFKKNKWVIDDLRNWWF